MSETKCGYVTKIGVSLKMRTMYFGLKETIMGGKSFIFALPEYNKTESKQIFKMLKKTVKEKSRKKLPDKKRILVYVKYDPKSQKTVETVTKGDITMPVVSGIEIKFDY